MGIKIHVTPDLLRGKAGELRTLRANHDENMAKMRSLIMNLEEIFGGQAKEGMFAQYESMQSTFTNFSNMIEEYAKFLDKAAVDFEDRDNAGSSAINRNI